LFETANSTPEKDNKIEKPSEEELEIDDLDNILESNNHRFMKNKQLAL
jgi:hypothetical protein